MLNFHLELTRLPDGAVEIMAGDSVKIIDASMWCAILADLAKSGFDNSDSTRDWERAQSFHRVRCFGEKPKIQKAT